jgi:hypothetical protein
MKARVLYLAMLLLVLANTLIAQEPVQWSFTAKKISATQYQVQLTALIQPGYHIYAQKQPENAIALPTGIEFQRNPLLTFKGQVKEKGELKKVTEPTLGTEAFQYGGQVSFVQIVEIKRKVKTNINGNIEFQVCTDEFCLPPKTIPFNIAIEHAE